MDGSDPYTSRRARQRARRVQRERVTGALVILLGIVVAVVAVVALRGNDDRRPGSSTGTGSPTAVHSAGGSGTASGHPSSHSAAPSSAGSSTGTTDATITGKDKSIPVVVLNNTTVRGLAQQAASQFRSGGWTVGSVGNLPGDISDIVSTCAYYDPSAAGAAQAAQALQSQFPQIKRVKARFDGLPAGPVVVVLEPDYSSG